MYYQPTPVSWENYHFLIMSSPDNQNLRTCIRDLKQHGVKLLVAACEQNYDIDSLIKADIEVVNMNFDDGATPDPKSIQAWTNKVDEFFGEASQGMVEKPNQS